MVVDAALVVEEVVVDHVGHGHGSPRHQGLHHEVLAAPAVVSAEEGVVADVGASAGRVGGARVVLEGGRESGSGEGRWAQEEKETRQMGN